MSLPDGTGPRRGARLAEAVALLALFGPLALYLCRPVWNIDLFWHIAAGRAFVTLGGLPETDVFSAVDPDRTWITFQWGYELATYLLDELGGLDLVRAVHGAVVLAAFVLFWWGCRRRLGLGALPAFVATALLLVLFGDRIRARPHVVNLLAWAALFPCLLRGPPALDRRAIIATAAILFVWANLHAGGALLFLIAAATLPAGAVGARLLGTADDAPEAPKRTLTWWAAAAIPALLSPHFVRGNVQALVMLQSTESVIGEWKPAWHYLGLGTRELLAEDPKLNAAAPAHLLAGAAPLAFAAAWLGAAASRLRGGLGATLRAWPLWALLLALALTVLGHRSVRFVWVAAVGAVLVGLRAPPRSLLERLRPAVRRASGGLAAAALLVVAFRFNVTAQHGDLATFAARAFTGPPYEARRFPTAQADFLERTGFEGDVLCQANWGGFLLWRLWPDVRVTADGRGNYSAELARDLSWLYEPANFRDPAAGAEVERIYQRYAVDAVVHQHPVWPRGYRPPAEEWTRVKADRKGAIWVRHTERGRAYLERLRGHR